MFTVFTRMPGWPCPSIAEGPLTWSYLPWKSPGSMESFRNTACLSSARLFSAERESLASADSGLGRAGARPQHTHPRKESHTCFCGGQGSGGRRDSIKLKSLQFTFRKELH